MDDQYFEATETPASGTRLAIDPADGRSKPAATVQDAPESAAGEAPAVEAGAEAGAEAEDTGGLDLSEAGRQVLKYSLPSLAVAGSIGLLGLARERFQHSHMFVPERYPVGDWEPEGLTFEDVHFASEDGTALHGWWMPNPKPDSHPDGPMTVLYCHGNTGNVADRADYFKGLHRLGVDIFAFDYRGYGRSEGSPTEEGVCMDVRAAIDHLTGELGRPFHRLILFGHSLGGAIAIDGAFHRRQVAGLVVQASFTQNLDMARHFYPDLPVHWITRNGFRSIEKVVDLAMPKLFIHGRADEKIPFEQGEALFAAAAEPKTFLPIARAGHGDLHQWGGLRYFSHLKRLGRAARRYGQARVAEIRAAEVQDDEARGEEVSTSEDPSTETQTADDSLTQTRTAKV